MATILVIDDEKSIRNTLQEVLEYENHKVDLATNGAEGVELFSNNSYDIVLCDIKCPVWTDWKCSKNFMKRRMIFL